MDVSVCREHLERLLAEETDALTRLEVLLDREHEHLLANDIDELDRAGIERQSCISDLVRIEDERRSMCRMMNFGTDHVGVEKLLTWCDPSKKIQRRWAASHEQASRCRDLNERNGALVAVRLKRVEGMLGVIAGRDQRPPVYGRQGSYAATSRQNVLAKV